MCEGSCLDAATDMLNKWGKSYFREFLNSNMHYFKMAVDVTRKILHIFVDIFWMISHHQECIFNTITQYIWTTADIFTLKVLYVCIKFLHITFKPWDILSIKEFFWSI